MGAIGGGQRFCKFFCEQGVPYHLVELTHRFRAGLAFAFRLLCLDFRRERLLQLQRFILSSVSIICFCTPVMMIVVACANI